MTERRVRALEEARSREAAGDGTPNVIGRPADVPAPRRPPPTSFAGTVGAVALVGCDQGAEGDINAIIEDLLSLSRIEQEREQGRWWSEYMKSAGYRTYMTGKWHVKAKSNLAFDFQVNERPGMPNQTETGYKCRVDITPFFLQR